MRKLCLAVIVILLQASCTSMEAVQKYAVSVQATVGEVRPVAGDFHASCMRANQYKPYDSKKDCTKEQEASQAIVKVANVLNDYASALGALASDGFVQYNEDISSLTNELKGQKVDGLNDEKIDAVGSLANFIATAATKVYQQKQVGKFIKESHNSVANVSDILADLLEINYKKAIELELSAWEFGYIEVESISRESERAAWESYAQKQWELKVSLEEKKNAVAGLAQTVRQIGVTHGKLKKDASNLDAKEVQAFVKNFISEVKPVIKEVQDAF